MLIFDKIPNDYNPRNCITLWIEKERFLLSWCYGVNAVSRHFFFFVLIFRILIQRKLWWNPKDFHLKWNPKVFRPSHPNTNISNIERVAVIDILLSVNTSLMQSVFTRRWRNHPSEQLHGGERRIRGKFMQECLNFKFFLPGRIKPHIWF